jgi:hypothetical protein
MLISKDCIVVIDSNVPTVHVAVHHWQPNTPDGLGAPFLFHHGKNAINSSGGAIFRIFKGSSGSTEDYQFPRAVAFAASAVQNSSAVVVTCDKEVITGNYFLAIFFLQCYSMKNWCSSIHFVLSFLLQNKMLKGYGVKHLVFLSVPE